MGDPVLLDELQVLLGIEALHDDRRAAAADRQADRPLRRRVVERRGRQVDHALAVAPLVVQELHQRQRLAGRPSGSGRMMPFGRPVVPDE